MKNNFLKKVLQDKKHFIFDVDETLYISPSLARERKKKYLQLFLNKRNIPKDEALREFLALEKKGLRFNEICQRLVGSFVSVQNMALNEIEVTKFISPNERLVKFIKMLPGSKIILSDASRIGVELTLKSLGFETVEDYFSFIYTIDDFKVPKPNNFGLKKILQKHQLDPRKCVVFGDSYEYDISPAKKEKITTVHINVRNEKTDADFSFSSLDLFLDHAI